MFSKTSEYALRAVVCLADSGRRPLTTQELAKLTKVPRDYLAKVMQGLGRAEIVLAQRGKHGGFTLARPAREITLFDVVQAVDPIQRIRRCTLRPSAHRTQLCPLHRRIDAALEQLEREFREARIADLLGLPAGIKPLCEVVEAAHA